MKKIKNLLLSTLFIVLSLFTFTACKQSPYKSLDVSYVGEYDYDTAKNVIMVEYGEIIVLSPEDFSATVTFENGKSKKTDKFSIDATSVNRKAPSVGDYKIFFTYEEQTDKFEMTVRVYEKAVSKPYLDSYKTTYNGEVVNVENYITSLPAFNSEYMEIDRSLSTISATNAGDYKVYINLKAGYVWNTATGKYTSIEFKWKIEKKKISIPTINGSSTFTYKFDSVYNAVKQTLLFNENQDEKEFYIMSDESASLAGNYTASVKIKDQYVNNYCFADQTSEKTFDYQILPYQLDKVILADSGRYTFTGEAVSPNLSNFIDEIMTKSDVSNNINASDNAYIQTIELRQNHKTNYVWKGENAISSIRILYEIQKKHIAKPVLRQSEYIYTGKAITPEFLNFDQDLEISDTSANIGVGIYHITIKLKSSLNPSNYTLEGADSASSIIYNYSIVAKNYLISFNWDKPVNAVYNGSTQFVNLFIDGEEIDSLKIRTTYTYFLKDADGNYNEVENLIFAGEYKIVATISYDNINNVVKVNDNPPRSILASDLETEFVVSKAEIDCSMISLSNSNPMYDKNKTITPKFSTVDNLTIERYEIYQNSVKVDAIADAGKYDVKIYVSYDENNYVLKNFNDTFVLTVRPKTISRNAFEWNYKEPFTYDKTEKTVSLVCKNKDYDFLIISYENNKATDPGTYTAIAYVAINEDQTNYSLNDDAKSFQIEFQIVRGNSLLKVKYDNYEFYYDEFSSGVDTNFNNDKLSSEGYYKAKIEKQGITSLEKIILNLSSKEGASKFYSTNYPDENGNCEFDVETDTKSGIKYVDVWLNNLDVWFRIELYEAPPVSITIGERSFSFALIDEKNVSSDFEENKGTYELLLSKSEFEVIERTEIEITFTFLNNTVGTTDKRYIFTTDSESVNEMSYPTKDFVDVSTLENSLSKVLTVSIENDCITLYVSTVAIEEDGILMVEYNTITIIFA